MLNAQNFDFGTFKVLVTDAVGSQTAMTLAQLGITQIKLKTDATAIRFADGSQVTGQSSFVSNGVVQTAGAVTLVSKADGRNRSRNYVAHVFHLDFLELGMRRSGFSSSVGHCNA